MSKSMNMVWLDMEMSGLDPEVNRILEVAMVVTDSDLNEIARSPVWVVHQSDEVLDAMDAWNQSMHGRSGLIDKVKLSDKTEQQVEQEMIEWIKPYVKKGACPLCGNSVSQDRRFLYKYMPTFETWLHYRTIDVSTFKELAKRWAPDVYARFEKQSKHEALADILESIAELAHYRQYFLKV
ncbi:MAG: oligoribonuclease [Alcaligenaceae bacterium]|nr:oligoribonuclease [Alcaligenaceae bacterium]